jgi:genome maintenance exonuclease 1
MFVHVPLVLPKLKRTLVNGKRYYTNDTHDFRYVSITSITSNYKKEFFKEWRNRVGEDKADEITKKSTSRGTDTHTLIEHYLNNEEELPTVQPLSEMLFEVIKPSLDRITNIRMLEGSLYSDKLQVAGTTDCIADFDGELSIIDFKTSVKSKPVEWLEGYFVQAVAYSAMLFERTGLQAKKLVILMACENGELAIYESDEIGRYLKTLLQYIKKYRNDYSR